ncbi:hypothetical protein Tco_0144799 [Tanacetum coccineum]
MEFIAIPKLELESSRFTFDLVPLSYESVDVVVGENWCWHKAERRLCPRVPSGKENVGSYYVRVAKEGSEAKNEFEIDVRRSDLADTMLCGFKLTNRWMSIKKDIASCGSKYLAYAKMEVEYKGSSGLLLQPELFE